MYVWYFMSMRKLFVLLGVLLCVHCHKDPFVKYRALAQPQVAAVRALAQKPLPSVTQDTLAFEGPLWQVNMLQGDTAVFPAEALSSLGSGIYVSALFPSEYSIDQASQWLEQNKMPPYTSQETVDEKMQSLLRLKKVFVVKTLEWTKPVLAETREKFVLGRYQGEAHLFDLAGKYYGAVRFEGANSQTVDFTKWVNKETGRSTHDDATAALEQDLRRNAWNAFLAAVKKRNADVRFQSML